MSIACVSCTCGFADSLIRTRLDRYDYKEAFSTPITKGKEKTNSFLNTLPQHEELSMLRNHIKGASKYAVVIGYNDEAMKWVDLANGKAVINNVALEQILNYFA
jgi:hypothetical protein